MPSTIEMPHEDRRMLQKHLEVLRRRLQRGTDGEVKLQLQDSNDRSHQCYILKILSSENWFFIPLHKREDEIARVFLHFYDLDKGQQNIECFVNNSDYIGAIEDQLNEYMSETEVTNVNYYPRKVST